MPFTLKSLLMDFLSWISNLSDLSPCAGFWESSLTCSRCVCPVLSISTLEKKPLILKEHSLLLPVSLCVLTSGSQFRAGSVRAASWPCPAEGGWFSLRALCPRSWAQHAPDGEQLAGICSCLRQRLKPSSLSEGISAALSSLPVGFQSEGVFLSELPF